MYSFAAIPRCIRALEKRLAKDLAIVRLRRGAEDFCDDYEDAVSVDPPSSRPTAPNPGAQPIPSNPKQKTLRPRRLNPVSALSVPSVVNKPPQLTVP